MTDDGDGLTDEQREILDKIIKLRQYAKNLKDGKIPIPNYHETQEILSELDSLERRAKGPKPKKL